MLGKMNDMLLWDSDYNGAIDTNIMATHCSQKDRSIRKIDPNYSFVKLISLLLNIKNEKNRVINESQ